MISRRRPTTRALSYRKFATDAAAVCDYKDADDANLDLTTEGMNCLPDQLRRQFIYLSILFCSNSS